MPTEMLDRLQEDKLQGLEALIDSYETAAAAGGAEEEAAAIADFFVDEGIGVRQSSLHSGTITGQGRSQGKYWIGGNAGRNSCRCWSGAGASFVVVRHCPSLRGFVRPRSRPTGPV